MEASHGTEEADQDLERSPLCKMRTCAGLKVAMLQETALNSSGSSAGDQADKKRNKHWDVVGEFLKQMAQGKRTYSDLEALAERGQLPFNDVLTAKAFFDEFQENHTCNGYMEPSDFATAAVQLMSQHGICQGAVQGRMARIGERVKQAAKQEALGFEEFLAWYCVGLRDHMQLSELAARHQVNIEYIIHLKRCFEASDVDQSGCVDSMEQLMQLLQRVLRIPSHLELPLSRVKMFLNELCKGAEIAVTFDDFLDWWLKYFRDESPHDTAPFEKFYCQVRRLDRQDPHVPGSQGKPCGVDMVLHEEMPQKRLHQAIWQAVMRHKKR